MKTNDYARVLSRGKSFEFSSWECYNTYTNDCFKQDWVSCDNALLVCIKTHQANDANKPTFELDENNQIISMHPNEYWEFVLSKGYGVTGPKGEDGKSAFEIAQEHGFEGDEQQWLDFLKGKDGKDGKPFTYEDFTKEQLEGLRGPAGPKGDKGDPGSINYPTFHINVGMHLIMNTDFESDKDKFIIDSNGHLNLVY